MSFKARNANKSSRLCVLSDLSNYTECITIVWFDSKFLSFYVNFMFRTLWIGNHDVNFTYGNHSINQDSAHWPMGIKMLRPISDYLVRELAKSWRNAKLNTILQCILIYHYVNGYVRNIPNLSVQYHTQGC